MKERKMKRTGIRRFLLQAVCLFGAVMLISFTGPGRLCARADFGDSNDYSSDSGGGSDWGSSSGGDYSYSDYDSDSDSDEADGWDITGVAVVLALYLIFHGTKKMLNGEKGGKTKKEEPESWPQQIVTEQVLDHDPDFSENDFISYASRSFVNIQTAWSAGDLEPVRAVLHANLYEQTAAQLAAKRKSGIVNCLERVAVRNCTLSDYKHDSTDEYLYATIDAQMVDYQYRVSDRKVVAGDPNVLWYITYRVCFRRPFGVKTNPAGIGVRSAVCPHCGAPLSMNAYGKCEYCGSVISTGEYDWVISELKTMHKSKNAI